MTSSGSKGPSSPQDVHPCWGEAFNAGDLECLTALYEESAVFRPQPGQAVCGIAAIRQALAGFLALKAKFEIHSTDILQAEDIALIYSSWSLRGRNADGSALAMTGTTSDVVRRQSDGSWLFAIDNPDGGKV